MSWIEYNDPQDAQRHDHEITETARVHIRCWWRDSHTTDIWCLPYMALGVQQLWEYGFGACAVIMGGNGSDD